LTTKTGTVWALALAIVVLLSGCVVSTAPSFEAAEEYGQLGLYQPESEMAAAAASSSIRFQAIPSSQFAVADTGSAGEEDEDAEEYENEPDGQGQVALPAPAQPAAPASPPPAQPAPQAATSEPAMQPNLGGIQPGGDMDIHPPVDTQAFAAEVVRLVNMQRAVEGLGPLEANQRLWTAAHVRAREIPALFSHSRPDGREWHTVFAEAGVQISGGGENIASGHITPQAVVNGWMNSPSHRANILAPNFTRIGVGVHQDETGRVHWVQLFAARLQ